MKIIFFLICPGLLMAQSSGGVFNPQKATDFSVIDCFKNSKYTGNFRADSVKPGYIFKGVRIWRSVNLQNKQNGVIFRSNNRCAGVGLFEIIKFGLFEKKLNAFSSDDFNEAVSSRLSTTDLLNLISLHDSSESKSFDANGNSVSEKAIVNRYLTSSDIRGYLIKEDWIVNNKSGRIEKYIIGLAPLVYNKSIEKNLPLFWLYYREWEELFASFEAENFYTNDRISFRDVFKEKYFISRVSKENNMFDRSVNSYSHGKDANLENDLIKEKLNNMESDLFSH